MASGKTESFKLQRYHRRFELQTCPAYHVVKQCSAAFSFLSARTIAISTCADLSSLLRLQLSLHTLQDITAESLNTNGDVAIALLSWNHSYIRQSKRVPVNHLRMRFVIWHYVSSQKDCITIPHPRLARCCSARNGGASRPNQIKG